MTEKKEWTSMDAFNASSRFNKEAEIGFGTGSRPPLNVPTAGPGPGAYVIKTTMAKCMESHIPSPNQFSLRGRVKFGDPNEKSMNKTSSNEPGPGQYDLTGKFLNGENPRKSGFPKGQFKDKNSQGPGPGSYKPLESMGKQVVSTKKTSEFVAFGKDARKGMASTNDVPGPGQYRPSPAACDHQVTSNKPSCGSIKFGTGYKKSKNNDTKFDFSEPSPGPGSYTLPGGIATKAKGSPFRDSPAATISGRTSFGSPFGRGV